MDTLSLSADAAGAPGHDLPARATASSKSLQRQRAESQQRFKRSDSQGLSSAVVTGSLGFTDLKKA